MTLRVKAEEKTYWRSLEELAATPEFTDFLHREFPVAASEFPQGMSRRRWLQLMGASLALAGLPGCRWEKETIAPFAARPENRVPGVPQRFASSIELGGAARPLVVTAYDGRPIKIEGNPEHPASQGATDAFSQATLLHLYDPDRSQEVLQFEQSKRYVRTWDDFSEFIKPVLEAAQGTGGSGIRVLAERSSSPSRARLADRFLQRFPQAKWYEHEALSRRNERVGTRLAFGEELRPVYELPAANVVLALDSDLLDFHPDSVRLIRGWSERRVPEAGALNRVYAVESQFSSIGSAADHRLPMRSSDIAAFLEKVESALVEQQAPPQPDAGHAGPDDFAAKFLRALCSDLLSNKGQSLIVVGPTQPAEVHARAFRLNALLENVGKTITFVREPKSHAVDTDDALQALTAEIESGGIDVLITLGGNPAYESPGFAKAQAKVAHRWRLGSYLDETSLGATWQLPLSHPLESWGDGYSQDGLLTLRQPLIAPIFNSHSAEEFLALLGEAGEKTDEAIVRETLKPIVDSPQFDEAWRKLVHDGFLPDAGLESVTPTVAGRPNSERSNSADVGLEAVFTLSPSTYDGRFANNGWLQETPAMLTKLTWQNAAILAPATAAKQGVVTGDVVQVTVGGATAEIPVYVLPGQAENSVGLALGYGRTAAGHVGGDVAADVAPVGANLYPLRKTAATTVDLGVKIAATGRKVTLAITQDHHAIDKVGLAELAGRIGELVREGTTTQYAEHPDFAQHGGPHHPPLESLWEERSAEGHAWGMAIDLSRCIGCNACLVACQAENNVPIVGPEQVAKGREMHWIRIDRYFAGEVDNPTVVTQPVTCQHCENAPCEQVCPVAATVHSPEGLNDMAYNRCVGTRYCANNCPYKVRRFNFLDFTSHLSRANEELSRLIINPEVTVRSRGVMEKCTFCVQRIQNVKIQAKNGQQPIADGAIQTACQQACPASAILFGDLMDRASQVSQAHANPRAYALLDELNVKPRTRYLARIRNPHPDLAASDPHVAHEHH